jgi:hypothetical protein
MNRMNEELNDFKNRSGSFFRGAGANSQVVGMTKFGEL